MFHLTAKIERSWWKTYVNKYCTSAASIWNMMRAYDVLELKATNSTDQNIRPWYCIIISCPIEYPARWDIIWIFIENCSIAMWTTMGMIGNNFTITNYKHIQCMYKVYTAISLYAHLTFFWSAGLKWVAFFLLLNLFFLLLYYTIHPYIIYYLYNILQYTYYNCKGPWRIVSTYIINGLSFWFVIYTRWYVFVELIWWCRMNGCLDVRKSFRESEENVQVPTGK